MGVDTLQKMRQVHEALAVLPQVEIQMDHSIYAGIYTRTVFVPKNVVVVGVLVKKATTLIVSGHAKIFIGDQVTEAKGYLVMQGEPNRKQAALAIADTYFTMQFATNATTVEEAEAEFTDEVEQLQNHQLKLMEKSCLE